MTWRLAIMASGRGSNAEALLAAAQESRVPGKFVTIVSDREGAEVLARAERYGVPTRVIAAQSEEDLLAHFSSFSVDVVCLAGYMRILSPRVLNHFFDEGLGQARVLNIHPSLLPAYPGLRALERAFADRAPESGVTVHLVNAGVDEGPILGQARFLRESQDSFADFQARAQSLEHELYPRILAEFLSRLEKIRKCGGASK